MATEGGPGYPATARAMTISPCSSRCAKSRDVVLMDNRGTGKSGAIDCRKLQTGEKWTVKPVAACGESLGARAALYSTAYAADDLAADTRGAWDSANRSVWRLVRHVLRAGVCRQASRRVALHRSRRRVSAGWARLRLVSRRMPRRCGPNSTSPAGARRPAPGCPAVPSITCCPLSTGLRRDSVRCARRRQRRQRARFHRQCLAARHRHVRAARRPRDGARARRGRTGVRGRGSRTAAAAHGGDHQRRRFARPIADAAQVERRPRGGGDVPGSAADLRHAAAAGVCAPPTATAPSPSGERAFPDTYAPFTIDEYRGDAPRLRLPRSMRRMAGLPARAIRLHKSCAADAPYPDIPALIISGELDNITTPADGAAVAQAFKHGRQIRPRQQLSCQRPAARAQRLRRRIVRRFIATLSPGDVGLRVAGAAGAFGAAIRRAMRPSSIPRRP